MLAVMNTSLHSITTVKELFQLLSVCFLSLGAFAADSSSSPVFQMRLVADAASSDSEQMVVLDKSKDASQKETLHVLKNILIDQSAVKSATVTKDKQFGHPQIEIGFTSEGKKRFAEVTRESVGKRLAIVIGGQLYSAPRIMMEIPGGSAIISGSFSEQEAKELVTQITESLKR